MENPEGKYKKPKIFDPEIQATIRTNEQIIQETKDLIKKGFELIKDGVELLDAETMYLEHMEGDKEYIELEKDITGEIRPPVYSSEEIDASKQKVEILKAAIKKLNAQIDKMTLDNIHLDFINDQWKDIQEQFNQIILRVDKAQLN